MTRRNPTRHLHFWSRSAKRKQILITVITQARQTAAENILLALIIEHKAKPIRLKRAIKDHMEEYKDVWACVHNIVCRAAELFATNSAKEPKAF